MCINIPVRRTTRYYNLCLFLLVWLGIAAGGDWPFIGRAMAQTWTPALEFGSPYAISVLPGGETIQITGSFSWAVPQNLSAVLASTPGVKAIHLNSPGGLVQAGVAIAGIIRAHDLDTIVTRSCASACTFAFLGGRNRILVAGARLGFHASYAPNAPKRWLDANLRRAYGQFALPAPFIDHVLNTPSEQLWIPTEKELLDAGIISAPALSVSPAEPLPLTFGDQINTTSAVALTGYAKAFRTMVGSLEASPSICNGFLRGAAMPYKQYVAASDLKQWQAAAAEVRAGAGQAAVVERARKDQIRTAMFES